MKKIIFYLLIVLTISGCEKKYNYLNTPPVDPFEAPELAATASGSLQGARYGCSRNSHQRYHDGTDLLASEGTVVKAIYAGKVKKIRNNPITHPDYNKGKGNFVIIRSGGISVQYGHLKYNSNLSIKEEDDVVQGQNIGKTGSSGNANNVPNKHLHLCVSTDHFATNSNHVDPEGYTYTKYKKNGSPTTNAALYDNPNPVSCSNKEDVLTKFDPVTGIEIKKSDKEAPPCNVTYKCFKGFGPRGHHMLIINEEKWHYPETFDPAGSGPSTEVQVVGRATRTHCRQNDLRLIGFVEGWIHECEEEDDDGK